MGQENYCKLSRRKYIHGTRINCNCYIQIDLFILFASVFCSVVVNQMYWYRLKTIFDAIPSFQKFRNALRSIWLHRTRKTNEDRTGKKFDRFDEIERKIEREKSASGKWATTDNSNNFVMHDKLRKLLPNRSAPCDKWNEKTNRKLSLCAGDAGFACDFAALNNANGKKPNQS